MLLDILAILLGVLLGISEHTIHIGFIVFFIMVASHFFSVEDQWSRMTPYDLTHF
jgi:hypothetical protein